MPCARAGSGVARVDCPAADEGRLDTGVVKNDRGIPRMSNGCCCNDHWLVTKSAGPEVANLDVADWPASASLLSDVFLELPKLLRLTCAFPSSDDSEKWAPLAIN